MNLLNKARVAALLLLTMPMSAVMAETHAKDIPKHGKAEVLFDGKDLSHFDTFIKSTGLNSDPGHIFVVENGEIHVSGKEIGYIITKQEYRNYYLRAEFKWGNGTFVPRAGQARDRQFFDKRRKLILQFRDCQFPRSSGIRAEPHQTYCRPKS